MKTYVKRSAILGSLLACAVAIGYAETFIPLGTGFFGIKPGFANIATVVALYELGIFPSCAVSLCRILITGLLFGSPVAMLYAFCGGVLSLAVMCVMKRAGCSGTFGVCVSGAFFHNAGQLAAACAVLGSTAPLYYFPVLAVSGVFFGMLTGWLSKVVLRAIDGASQSSGARLFTRRDILPLSCVAAVTAACAVLLLLPRAGASYVEVRRDGELVAVYPLYTDAEFTVGTAEQHNTVVIKNGEAFVSESTCSGGDCVASGKISRSGESIVCLPNGFSIETVGDDKKTYDAVTY